MKLQKQVSRKTKTRAYEKWSIVLPNELVRDAGWKAGDDIEVRLENAQMILTKKNQPPKTKMKTSGKGELSALERLAFIYFNLPLQERKMPVVVIDREPVTWTMAYREMKHRTKIGAVIGQKLIKLGII